MTATNNDRWKGPRLNRDAFFADLGYEPHPAQKLIHASRASRRIVAAGVRFGKTRAAAMEVLAEAMEPRENAMLWCVGPTFELCEKVFREVVLLSSEHLRHRIILLRSHDKRLILRNMAGGVSEVRGKSADNPTSLLGEALDFLVIDEAARLPAKVWEGHLVQRLLDRNGKALLISTPYGKNWLFDLYRRGQSDDPDYASWQFPSAANPYLDAEMIKKERGRLPERVWNQEYLARWVEGQGSVFMRVREAAVGDWADPIPGEEYVIGVDLARVTDYTVAIVMDSNRRVVHLARFTRIPWDTQVARICAVAKRYNDGKLIVDSTGVGDPVVERLEREGCYVEGFRFSANSKKSLIDNLCLLLESDSITLPRPTISPEVVDEFEAYTFKVGETGHVTMSAPSGGHDDIVIAVGLAAWELRDQENGFKVYMNAGPALRSGRLRLR